MTLQIFRKIDIFVLSEESFSVLVTMIERSLDFCVLEKQIKYPIEMLLMCSTYYKLDSEGKKYYLKEEIKNHELFGFYEFWHSSLLYFVSKTIKRSLLSQEGKDRDELYAHNENLQIQVIQNFVYILGHMMLNDCFKGDKCREFFDEMAGIFKLDQNQVKQISKFISKN